ncbi:hypothetical protein GH714_039774 [Hevea brasiliensis]|uniref:URB1 C-terminal domain-containing protein n=1 Tax=Hevea brasiliensis TaxID=3981 RepID=A0A6A6KER7_HEVBR|nr:hypothetical protein GH714_039774 [Hevea brasiliensis]
MGYIEPVEFAGLGLLAVAFVSISSPDVGMRKLGYESLGRYKNALEGCQKKKDIMRLRLLLTYMQNGIKVPWQKIPSILALFAAESSLILLDPSNDHYTTLSKHLMHSSKVNMKVASDIISFRDINQWLQDCALEQLMELSSNLYKLLVGGLELIKENVSLIDSIPTDNDVNIEDIAEKEDLSTSFYFIDGGFFRIYQTLDACDTSRSSSNAEFGLQTILMSTPPVDIFYMVSLFLSINLHALDGLKCTCSLMIISEETPSDETLISKLLRWLVAAVILGKLYWKLNDVNSKYSEKSSSKSLQSFLEYVEMAHGGRNNCKFDCEEVLAATIIFPSTAFGSNSRVLSSVVFLHYVFVVLSNIQVILPTLEDRSLEMTDIEKMDEHNACQSLMVIMSNVHGKKTLDSEVLSCQVIGNTNVFEWERSIIEKPN